MGRKPNALILTHFERGAKLNDSSNRYQHTCKACGEKFPKGRIDSLTTHLVKKCPAISLRDRQKALLELNNLPDVSDTAKARNGEVQMNGPTVELPIATRDWTALETLAEVSRQIDLSEKHDDRSVNNQSAGAGSRASELRTDRLELQEQYTLDNPPVSYEQRVQRDKKGPTQKITRRESSTSLPPANFGSHMPNSRSASPTLAMAATRMAAAAAARFVPSMVDPQLLGEDSNTQIAEAHKALVQALNESNAAASNALSETYFQASSAEHQPTWAMLDGSANNIYPEPESALDHNLVDTETTSRSGYSQITINAPMTSEFSAEYGNEQRANKPKVRGQFNATRRREVQEVRKKGACIRCRMLKKPCSGETPCTTCANLESARLWKQPCIRTRIADELDMYAAGLHAVLAYHEVNSAKSQIPFVNSNFVIEASHYPETTIFATFNALAGQQGPMQPNVDPGLTADFSTSTLRILDNDKDDLPMKLEAYMKRMSSVFFAREPSHFMNITLNTALELSIEKQDALLTRVLEFWATVHILIDHELHWTISERADPIEASGQGTIIDQNSSDGSYGLLCLQLNAAAEKKAAKICKLVLNDLERRLLQRSSASSFETFLVAIILLNCVEKSTWLFKSWEQDSFMSRWPLDKKPIHYAAQGERITDMLQMLLRMRNVPPKLYTKADDGYLATDSDPAAKAYFEKLSLTYASVRDKQSNIEFDPANSRCYELRFCSRLLLPTV